MFWNFYRNFFNVLLENLMHMEHFEIYILKLIKKLISRKLMDQLNWNFVCFLFSKPDILSIKSIKFWQLIWRFQNALLILQTFRHFTYITAHSPTLPSLYLRLNSFPNPSVASPTSQLILQPLFRFFYVKDSSLTSPGEPPMLNEISSSKASQIKEY